MNKYFDVIIVGAGHAGTQVACQLRKRGFDGSIALIDKDSNLPYQRPPLSKEYLAGEKVFERLMFRAPDFWTEQNINLLMGQKAVEVDAAAAEVRLNSAGAGGAAVLKYGKLVWASGGSARMLPLPGSDLVGIHAIRRRSDVDAIRSSLETTTCIAIIGGGYIGLESAAVFRKLSKSVVLFEVLDRVLARVAGEELSRFYEEEHRAHGVDIRLNTAIKAFKGDDGRVAAVVLADGSEVPCELAIVGIGIVPDVAPLIAAGADGDNGVAVNEYCETTLPNVYAVGDCALHKNHFAGDTPVRLECVQNSTGMADCVVENILGSRQSYCELPWFWSNQYDLKLQTVGISAGYDRVVLRGRVEQKKFSIVYYREGRVIAIDCVNSPADFIQARRLLKSDCFVPEEKMSDITIPLKEMTG